MKINIRHFRKTVASAGTAEALTTSDISSRSVLIQAESDNTGRIFVGTETDVSSSDCFASLGAGESVTISGAQYGLADASVDLKDIWLDVGTNGDGAFVGYLLREENA